MSAAAVDRTPVPLERLIADALAADARFWADVRGRWARRQARSSRRLAELWAELADAAEQGRPVQVPGYLVRAVCDGDLRTRSAAHTYLASRIVVAAGGAA